MSDVLCEGLVETARVYQLVIDAVDGYGVHAVVEDVILRFALTDTKVAAFGPNEQGCLHGSAVDGMLPLNHCSPAFRLTFSFDAIVSNYKVCYSIQMP